VKEFKRVCSLAISVGSFCPHSVAGTDKVAPSPIKSPIKNKTIIIEDTKRSKRNFSNIRITGWKTSFKTKARTSGIMISAATEQAARTAREKSPPRKNVLGSIVIGGGKEFSVFIRLNIMKKVEYQQTL